MVAGGLIAAIGFGVTIAFSVRSKSLRRDAYGLAEERQRQDCSRMFPESNDCEGLGRRLDEARQSSDRADTTALAGGMVLAGGIAVVAIGGILHTIGVRKLRPVNEARLRMSPAWGGVVFSGRF